ncbi:hypothetical protein GIB67_004092 [Kingdonia uniflora]|uniref:Uncharacterized protein n=1 Tax=Kingdonia uniflora TaxID=39325 RepID=A0A7J7NRM4_9MAGN|nr:hypothetical protein GIB67_004092 [Kingdonia uniflora]
MAMMLLSSPSFSTPSNLLRRPKFSSLLQRTQSLVSSSPIGSSSIRCQALGESSPTVYNGIYGPWSVDSDDVREVISYRSGLVTASASFVIAASTAFLPDNIVKDIISQNIDLFYAFGTGGLGLSLFLIHIYVTEIKRTLQALWGIGVLGSLAAYVYLAHPVGQSLPEYVIGHPATVWFVGPLFAALTGLVFKEGLCYGKLEAGVLTFVIPTVLLGHLTGLMDDGVKLSLLGVWMALFAVFAARKFTQPIKDAKISVPEFDGKTDGDGFIYWLNRVDRVLAFKRCRDPRAVTLIETKLTGYALNWWEGVQQLRSCVIGTEAQRISRFKLGLTKRSHDKLTLFTAQSLSEDDIGDKSVFLFNALPEVEKKALLEKLQE